MSLVYTQRLKQRGIRISVGRVGDCYDNAMAESVNSLYKTELIYSRAWANTFEVEYATMHWVHWWNTQRLHGSLDLHPPEEVEADCHAHNTRPLTTTP